DCSVFPAGKRAPHGFYAGEVGGSRAHAEEERLQPAGVRSRSGAQARGKNGRLVRARSQAQADAAEVDGKCGRGPPRRCGERSSRKVCGCRGGIENRGPCPTEEDRQAWEEESRRQKIEKDIIRDHGATLRGNFRMGVSELDAGFLSSQASAERFPPALRQPAQHGRSQFYLPAIDQRDDRTEV